MRLPRTRPTGGPTRGRGYFRARVPEGTPYDAGLQPERTALAWRRNALAVGALALVCTRAAWGFGGGLLAVSPLAVAFAALGLYVAGEGRYRRTHATLTRSPGPAPLPDGRLLLATTACALTLGVTVALWWWARR